MILRPITPLVNPPAPPATGGPPRNTWPPITPARPVVNQRPPVPDTPPTVRASIEPTGGEVKPGAENLTFNVQIFNASAIVDAFAVEAVQPPPWLEVSSSELRLMPNTTDTAQVSARVTPGVIPPAGRLRVWIAVRSHADPSTAVRLPVDLVVPVMTAPMVLTVQPALVRTSEQRPGLFVVVVDNSAGNQVRHAVLGGEDPERQVRFTFTPPSVDVPPGGTAQVRVSVQAPSPEPGREVSRLLTIFLVDRSRSVTATATLVQSAAPAPVDVPYEIELTPSLLRLRDASSAIVRVVVDNKQGVRARKVTLMGSDPERALHFQFRPTVVEVGPRMESAAEMRVAARPPEPGSELTRPFTVTGWDGTKEVAATGSLVLSTSPGAVDKPLAARLEPSVLRMRDSSRAGTALIVDNRGGSRARRVRFGGYDPERVFAFSFGAEFVDVPAGQVATVHVQVSAPGGAAGSQITRPFTVVASDGQAEIEAAGSFVQEFSDRRPLWRTLLTLTGSVLMALATLLPWNVGASFRIDPDVGSQVAPDVTGLEWGLPAVDAVSRAANKPLNLPNLPDAIDPIVSAGAVFLVLAALVLLGRIGASGRLTRFAALIAALLLAGLLIAASLAPDTGSVGPGLIFAFLGCALAFGGGLLAKSK